MKKILGLGFVILLGAAGFAVWKGNQPLITYYQNGNIKTMVQRHFFKENGEYNKYNEDGTMSQKYTLLNGRKIGMAHIYGDNFVLDVNYLDGKLLGPVKIDTHQASPEIEKIKINIGQEMTFSAYTDSEDDFRVDGKIKCDDETFFNNIQNAFKKKDADSVRAALNCLSWNKLMFQDEDFKCTYEGDYQYPSFKQDSHISCNGFGNLASVKDTYMGMYGGSATSENKAEDSQDYSINADYSVENKALDISISNKDGSYKQIQTYKGFENVTESLLNFGFSAQEGKDLVKLVVDVLKNLTVSESTAVVGGKKVAEVKGDFNIVNGFSNPWSTSFFDEGGNVSSQLKITEKGVMINTRYPVSKTQMFALSLQITDTFKTKYQELLDKVISEFESKEPEQAVKALTEIWPQYAMNFTDVVQSVNMMLSNKKGEKVLAAVISTKKGADLTTLMMTPEVAIDAKIISYKDGKVYKVITGNLTDGFMVDGKKIGVEEINNYLDLAALEQVMKDIDAEFTQAYKDVEQKIKEGKFVSDPFMVGFYSGYSKAMSKYKANKIIDQSTMIIVNTRVLFASQESYEKLDAELAGRVGVIPEEMLSEGNNITNIAGGAVKIYPSGKEEEGDNKAFVLEFHGLTDEMCVQAALADWGFNNSSGLVAMGVNEAVSDRYLGACRSSDKVACGGGEQMNPFVAYENCQNNDDNTIYWKYF